MSNNQPSELEIIRHGVAHVLMHALSRLYSAIPGVGPAIETGFYHDFEADYQVTEDDLKKIETEMNKIIKEKIPIVKTTLDIDKGIEMLNEKGYTYTAELAQDLKDKGEKEITIYEQGDFINMCRGPHLENTGDLKHFKLLSVAGAYWKGDDKNTMLQRIYGTAFATKDELMKYLKQREEAFQRDHNKLGRELDLFITSEPVGQGLPLLTPKGTTIFNTLVRWIEDEERKRGYQLTKTPYLAKSDLYKISGHWDHYRDGMFVIQDEDTELALRPMTCPFQFQIYNSRKRSYRDLPIRYNETSTLFRNETSGEMHGLIRLRQFTLSEGHLICRMDQLEEEFEGVLDLINHIMQTLDLTDYWYRFSKWDPEDKKGKYIDNPEAWNESQAVLKKILDKNKLEYVEADGEAAFYGPKLDIQMRNVFGKEDTIITVQIDFALPERFDMNYTDQHGKNVRPIIIHRSSIGCYERTLALLIEKYAGAFPAWLAPTQVMIIPVSEKFNDYGNQVLKQLSDKEIRVDIDVSDESLGKRIRNAEKAKTPYILVVGEKEQANESVAVRKRSEGDLGSQSIDEFSLNILKEIEHKLN